jgi:hypothetical protein
MSKINSLFWSEFSETCSSNRVLSDSQLAEKLLETFRKFYDNNVAIEVSSDYTNREIIFC